MLIILAIRLLFDKPGSAAQRACCDTRFVRSLLNKLAYSNQILSSASEGVVINSKGKFKRRI